MSGMLRGFQHDTEVLIRQVDGRLATLRITPQTHDAGLAERLASALRALIIATTRASATDRARVRAAVHYFVLGRDTRYERRSAGTLSQELWVINRTARELGREDLVVAYDGAVPCDGVVADIA